MSWARIVFYYAVAAVLTFHLAGVAAKRNEAGKPAEKDARPFLEAVPERIDRVRLEQEGMEVQFERKDGRWLVTEPAGLAPPGDVVDAVLESLTSLPAIDIVADGVEHEGQFGFVPPRARIRIEQQGALVSTVILGELNPTRTSVYAKRSGSDEVALIGLNAKYYLDLIFENVRRQRSSDGAVPPPADLAVPPPPVGMPPAVAVPPAGAPPPKADRAPAAAPPR